MTNAMEKAKDRRLEWLLREAVGGRGPSSTRTPVPQTSAPAHRWLLAAVALLAPLVVYGVATLEDSEQHASPAPASPQGAPVWHDVRDAGDIANLPADAINLRCYGFDDAGLAALSQLTRIKRLDLGPVNRSGANEPPAISDAGVALLGDLKLTDLSLRGCAALTDDIGATLSRMVTLRRLDLAAMPKITAALLPQLPAGLVALALDGNHRLRGRGLRRLPELPNLLELSLDDVPAITDDDLRLILEGRGLAVLRLGGGHPVHRNGAVMIPTDSQLTSAARESISAHTSLTELGLSGSVPWLDASVMASIGGLPALLELDLAGNNTITGELLAPLATSRSLHTLRLTNCKRVRSDALDGLAGLALRRLDLDGTNLTEAAVKAAARAWPGCQVTMPDGSRYQVPVK